MERRELDLQMVSNEESVARIIFSPSYIFQGRVSPTAFRWFVLPSGHAENYISVLRDDGSDFNEASLTFRPRTQGDDRYGYALLNVGDIRNVSQSVLLEDPTRVDVLPFPSKKHSNHAGIQVTIDGVIVDANTPANAEIMAIQKELAMRCSEIVPFETASTPIR